MAVQNQPVGQILGSTLDSDLLSEILQIIHKYFLHFKIAITKLLLELGKNIEMSILAMFLLNNDKICEYSGSSGIQFVLEAILIDVFHSQYSLK